MEIAMVSKIWLLWISRQWIPVYRSLWGHVFIWKSDLRVEGKACSNGECMFNFMRSCQTAFQRGGFMLHSLQHYVRISAVLHTCQHLVWSLFNFSHSNSLWWYLIVIFNLFSPDDYWCWAFFHVLMCYLYIFTYSLIFLVMCLFKSFTHLY